MIRRTLPCIATALALVWATVPARASMSAESPWLIPPVDGPVGRHYEEPGTRWGPGHRGLDYYVAPGTSVRAAGDGVISWAGPVAGRLVVTIDHGGGLWSSYSELSQLLVGAGAVVRAGTWIGRAGVTHAGARSGVHFSVRSDGVYVDPARFLGPVDPAAAIHLAPVVGWGLEEVPHWLRPSGGPAGTHVRSCVEVPALPASPPAPNGNVVIAVAGIGSSTRPDVNASIYEHGPQLLGYAPDRIYRFSYEGTSGPRFHEPYDPAATTGNLSVAAARLEELVAQVGRAHPGVDIDLIAHSQGGIVARLFLEMRSRAWDPELPRVAHLVTFSSPHQGAPAAELADDLRGIGLGRDIVDAASAWARSCGPVPDPHRAAVAQLAPGSPLMRWLAATDVGIGTRVLTLAAPDDVVVPPHRASIPGERHAVVGPSDGFGHSAILTSSSALALAHSFLRDASPACPGAWDRWGGVAGRAVEAVYDSVPWGVRAVEQLGGG